MDNMSSENEADIPQFGTKPPEPTERVGKAIREFAQTNDVDPQLLLDGERFEWKKKGMWLRHFGDKDPDAVVLMIDMGDFPEEEPVPFLRFALEHNAFTPAAVHGYYALVPGSNTITYCVRLDIADEPSGAAAIAVLITTLVNAEEYLQKVVGKFYEGEAEQAAGIAKVFA
jgi:hypothetical protein